MNDLSLLVDLHREGKRQGPGGDDETRLAITLSGLRERKGLKIADIGCGTGASTLVLAKDLDASVTAVDLLPDFLRGLEIAAERQRLTKRIETLAASTKLKATLNRGCSNQKGDSAETPLSFGSNRATAMVQSESLAADADSGADWSKNDRGSARSPRHAHSENRYSMSVMPACTAP